MKGIKSNTVIATLEKINTKLAQANKCCKFELAKINTNQYGIFCVFNDYKSLYFQNKLLYKLFQDFTNYINNMVTLGI